VSDVAADLALLVEKDDFSRRPPVRAHVLEHEAVDADEELARTEVKLRILLEPRGEVRPQRVAS
jgi:hypothetical protein